MRSSKLYANYSSNIRQAKYEEKPWDSYLVKDFKLWMKHKRLEEQDYFCCYCLRCIKNESDRVKHIEHILPKSKFPAYMFDAFNLSVSCVKCNCDIKLSGTDFLNDQMLGFRKSWSYRVYDSKLYRFIHPKLDNINDYLTRELKSINNRPSYVYKYFGDKGKFHYDFFRLKEFEVFDINSSQGLTSPAPSSEAASIVAAIYKKHT
ncbi:TPA: hypothetical protein JG855_004533 [Vibrio parahaemolyticus]|nr:hypothetical protein CGJ87_24035 [Vibrio parahaemolyticus]TOD02368.1 hypothetical protein CGJ71_23690 [Vibrio parahaemolyticus]TOD26346.1 hypothetical protein CGJ67_23260 [Vibrio parahaemolyticus]TOD82593.1 hypothetical protein CGJ55_23475 [Vibrio parahaemolyticus]HAV1500367.1 hypothetical protein [Vibrio parahaemolyticus]